MGNFLTHFHDYRNGFAPDLTSAKQKDWITLHAELSALSIVEVERLWARFQQLGCDDEGVLHVPDMKNNHRFTEDIFMKNLLISLAIDQKVYFQTFLNCMKWADNATSEEKCKAIFSFFNQGNPLAKDLFRRVLGRAYPDKDDATLARYSEIVFNKLSGGNADMNYDDFMKFCNVLNPADLDRVVDFTIIPDEINIEAHRRFSSQWVSKNDNSQPIRDRSDDVLVCDESLKELSIIITDNNLDWKKLGGNIGYSTQQLNKFEQQTSDDQQRMYKMLTMWKKINGEDATNATLRHYLGNNIKLNPHVFG